MKVTVPEISWHERDPIYSVDIQPGNHVIKRLVSAGVDKFVRIWQLKEDLDGKGCVEFLANLKRHTKAVNVCRFSPDGDTLATAGDDSVIIFWKLNDASANTNIFQEEEEDNKENWCMQKCLRGHLEDIYDLSWSQDGKYMISGSVDNSAILWDLTKDQKITIFNEHKSFVQGVAWDPKNEFVATLSTDRSCRVYNISSRSCVHNVSKMNLPSKNLSENDENKDSKPKSFRMFHDDTMRSFFRRLTFTPDGELLIVPAGIVGVDHVTNATFIFTRNSLAKPAVYLPSPDKVTIAVRCCPTKFQLRKIPRKLSTGHKNNEKEWEKYSTMFCLPYRMVFAVATEDSIQLYDTQQLQPFGFITNIHYHQLSDVTWSTDGSILVASSTDGYCTIVTFTNGELGQPYRDTVPETKPVIHEQIINAMEMESESLHLVLETSVDSSSSFDIHNRVSANEVKQREVTPTAERKQSEITSTIERKPMEIKVKSVDGKLKNVQIQTLSTTPLSDIKLSPTTAPSIQVKSVDGKPKNVQITTLATFSSPNSSGDSCASVTKTPESENRSKVALVASGISSFNDNIIIIDSTSEYKKEIVSTCPGTPKSVAGVLKQNLVSGSDKTTPKRVQLTTLELFNTGNSESPKHVKDV